MLILFLRLVYILIFKDTKLVSKIFYICTTKQFNLFLRTSLILDEATYIHTYLCLLTLTIISRRILYYITCASTNLFSEIALRIISMERIEIRENVYDETIISAFTYNMIIIQC